MGSLNNRHERPVAGKPVQDIVRSFGEPKLRCTPSLGSVLFLLKNALQGA